MLVEIKLPVVVNLVKVTEVFELCDLTIIYCVPVGALTKSTSVILQFVKLEYPDKGSLVVSRSSGSNTVR